MVSKAKIFISYAHFDREKATALHDRLKEAGFQPWMDKPDLPPGAVWKYHLEESLEDADFVVVCLTRQSVEKRGPFQREINKALDRLWDFMPKDIFLIPVRFEECEVPRHLAIKVQHIDYYKEGEWERLVEAIRAEVRRREKGRDLFRRRKRSRPSAEVKSDVGVGRRRYWDVWLMAGAVSVGGVGYLMFGHLVSLANAAYVYNYYFPRESKREITVEDDMLFEDKDDFVRNPGFSSKGEFWSIARQPGADDTEPTISTGGEHPLLLVLPPGSSVTLGQTGIDIPHFLGRFVALSVSGRVLSESSVSITRAIRRATGEPLLQGEAHTVASGPFRLEADVTGASGQMIGLQIGLQSAGQASAEVVVDEVKIGSYVNPGTMVVSLWAKLGLSWEQKPAAATAGRLTSRP